MTERRNHDEQTGSQAHWQVIQTCFDSPRRQDSFPGNKIHNKFTQLLAERTNDKFHNHVKID